jgi:hypothetical protein
MNYFLLFPCNATDFVGFVYIYCCLICGVLLRLVIMHGKYVVLCYILLCYEFVLLLPFFAIFLKNQNKQTRYHFNFKIK